MFKIEALKLCSSAFSSRQIPRRPIPVHGNRNFSVVMNGDHRWFEERTPACTRRVSIDDATSRRVHLYFTYSEATFCYFEVTRAQLDRHGKPLAFYSDKATVFRNSPKDAKDGFGHSQFDAARSTAQKDAAAQYFNNGGR
jgi:hypothetical protein